MREFVRFTHGVQSKLSDLMFCDICRCIPVWGVNLMRLQ